MVNLKSVNYYCKQKTENLFFILPSLKNMCILLFEQFKLKSTHFCVSLNCLLSFISVLINKINKRETLKK